MSKKVLLIGWDAADWKFLTPLMEQGLMPNLTKLVEGGVKGKLATLNPALSPMLWTSIATGKRPFKHGIHGFTEPNSNNSGLRPINSTNRKVKAIWNILSQESKKTNVIGWWPSHPSEPINGIMVSNFYQITTASINDHWPMNKGTIHPPEMSDFFANLRVHPEEFTDAHLFPFIPDAHTIPKWQDKRWMNLLTTLADCSSIHCAATYILEHQPWDFTAVYFDAIDHFCHSFMKYHPPHREHISKQDYELYKDVVNGGCRFHDMMLGRLMELAGEETTIMLISDHGFHPDHNRLKALPNEPAGPAAEHSPYGIFVVNGPGIKKDKLVFGASLLDITPTLLAIYGLPIGEDMDGKVLVDIFKDTPQIKTIRSWENIKGKDGSHPPDLEQSEEDMALELQQLIDLGYISDPGDNMEEAIRRTNNENNFYLAQSYYDGGEWQEGIKLLTALHQNNPGVSRYSFLLAHGHMVMAEYKKARTVVDNLRNNLDRENPNIDILEGMLLMAEQRYKKALELFKKAEKEAGELPQLNLRIANAYMQLNKLEMAENAALKSLQRDAENVHALQTLGVCCFRMMRYEEAVNYFTDAIGLMFYFPSSHFYLGKTLMAMEKYEEAAQALEICLQILPGLNEVKELLITIYEQFLNQPGKAKKYRTDFINSIVGEVTLVSGLPRSGTSMMMQMLEAGGLEIFTDKERAADENNPKGYYEHEAVKNLSKNKNWLPDARGKVVKVIAQLLEHLPMNYKYKVIFMQRNMIEVLQSQQRMLAREGKKVEPELLPLSLMNSYEKTLEKVKAWADKQPNVEIHYVNYSDFFKNPFMQAMLVNDFLDEQLKVEEMIKVVDSRLYRERSKEKDNLRN